LKRQSLISLGIVILTAIPLFFVLSIGSIAVYEYMFVPVWDEHLPMLNAMGQVVTITDYRNATNTTYANLTIFLDHDHTEDMPYVDPNYTCSDFAVALHDSAEAHGIRCGIVNVQFEGQPIGHAFDVFPTSDKGMVFVDATGLNASQLSQNMTPGKAAVYLMNGSQFGEIALNQTGGDFNYSFYLDRKQKIDVYKNEIDMWEANYSQYKKDFNAWNDSETELYNEFMNYSADVKNYNAQLVSYNAQMEAHNAAIQQYNSGNHGVSVPPIPSGGDQLKAWQNNLDAEYVSYADRNNDLIREGSALQDRYDALMVNYDWLKSQEEAKWIMYNPDGIVDEIGIFW
jgi:hypothetical protein